MAESYVTIHQRNENGRMMLESNKNGPLIYPTVKENGQIRKKKYLKLTEQEKLQDDCDVQAINIILQGLPPDVYSLVNHHQAAIYIWDKVNLLMKCTELSYQERECKLYNKFDKFASVNGKSLYEYYWRFSQLINDMHTIGMTMQQVQVNINFLNDLQQEWSKFVTDVKLAKNLYTTNYDQLYAYLSQHEGHANELSSIPQQAHSSQPYLPTYAAPIHHQQYQDLVRLAVSVFLPSDDPIAYLNKAMAFMSTVVASRFPLPNNQLRTSSNLRNNATIHDVGQARVVKCYNCHGEGHMARQCTKPKRPRNSAWFKEKMLLVQAHESDASSLSTSQTPPESQSPVASPGVVEEFHDIEVTHLDNEPFFGVPIPEPIFEESSSRDVIPTNVHSVNQPPKHISK
ncbi:uncharacterized mitochondrial protein-like protein [Tanacetum coccineum]